MLARVICLVVFALAGWGLYKTAFQNLSSTSDARTWILVSAGVGGLLGFIIGPILLRTPARSLLSALDRIPSSTVLVGTIGLIVGLAIAVLISIPFFQLEDGLNWIIPLAISGFLGVIGVSIGVRKERDFRGVEGMSHRSGRIPKSHIEGYILVDTSAIIDGRIADMSQTGFVQGTLVIPGFVLDELRHIADSSDSLRRTRGRRGLEVLSKLRKDGDLPVQILDAPLSNGSEVDAELVTLAKAMKAYILTTDFNLNRVAELQGVLVLNINELANALKPVVLPSEDLAVHIIQEGKELGQGVAFLDDGTMVVVEGGKRLMNSVQTVMVTRVLQTSAGRIIFAQPRNQY